MLTRNRTFRTDVGDVNQDVFIVLVKKNIMQKVQDTLDLWAKHLPLVMVHTLLGWFRIGGASGLRDGLEQS